MKLHGCVALVALAVCGCVSSRGQTVPLVNASLERSPTAPKTACVCQLEPCPPCRQPAVEATVNTFGLDRSPTPISPLNLETLPRIEEGPTIASQEKAESSAPAAPQVSDRSEPSTSNDPPKAIVERTDPPEPLPPVTEVDAPTSPLPAAPARPQVAKVKGRPVASVGTEIISLPELTKTTKARIAQLGSGTSLNRRQVIALSRATLKAMIVRSLIFQEALAKLGGPERLSEMETRSERIWADRELPALSRREGVTTESELRTKLAERLTTPEALRDEFIVRSVATELILLERLDLDYDSYLDSLKKSRPIRSIMTPAELMAAGRRAATDESSIQ